MTLETTSRYQLLDWLAAWLRDTQPVDGLFTIPGLLAALNGYSRCVFPFADTFTKSDVIGRLQFSEHWFEDSRRMIQVIPTGRGERVKINCRLDLPGVDAKVELETCPA